MSHGIECKIQQMTTQGAKLYQDERKQNGTTGAFGGRYINRHHCKSQ